MSLIGGGSPLPFGVGGGPSASMIVYESLKQMVGLGNYAQDGTIEAEWRMAIARGLEAAIDDDRAVMQAWPTTVTDFLPVFEEIFQITENAGLPDQERRDLLTDKWARQVEADTPSLQAQLQAIDPLFSIVTPDYDETRTTTFGRVFEDYAVGDPAAVGPAFTTGAGGREYTDYPNFSDNFVCIVLYAVAAGVPSAEQFRRVQRAADLLNETLPSWVSFRFIYSTSFILDTSLLDLGAFGS